MLFTEPGVGEDNKNDTDEVEGKTCPLDPPVVHEARDYEYRCSDADPCSLFVPVVISLEVGGAVNCHHTKECKGKRTGHQNPVHPEQFSQQRCHVLWERAGARELERRGCRGVFQAITGTAARSLRVYSC